MSEALLVQHAIEPVPAVAPREIATPLAQADPRASRVLQTVAILLLGVGILWREYYILWAHRPAGFIFSDMSVYCGLALRLASGDAAQTAHDTLFPPGNAYSLSLLHRLSGDWSAAAGASLLLCILAPILIYWLARQLADQRVACVAMAMASLYFPFIDYGGYFMAETPFTALLLLGTCLWLRARGRSTAGSMACWAFAAGAVLGLSALFKSHSLLVALAFAGASLLEATLARRPRLLLVPALAVLGLALAVAPASIRSTTLTGRFSVISTNGPVNVMVGHCDPDIRRLRFADPQGQTTFAQSPTAHQKGASRVVTFAFAQTDQRSCMNAAWGWIRTHPLQAVMQSCDHVLDLYGGRTYPWPPWVASPRALVMTFEKLALVFITIPSLFAVLLLWRRRGRADLAALAFLALPIACLWFTVFMTTAEPRYRVPFDGFAIVLAAMVYARWFAGTRPDDHAAPRA